jgi:thiosulfate reductase cytochrome b subunit
MASEAALAAPLNPPRPSEGRREVIYRHGVVVRVTHWLNVLALSLLLMSGLNIFNAHPELYWGKFGANFDPSWLAIGSSHTAAGVPHGFLRLFDVYFDTTGFLGLSVGPHGGQLHQGFPAWATLPSWRDLATARRWHFFLAWIFVANGLVYLLVGLMNGHLRRDLAPTLRELSPANIGQSVLDHLKLKHPTGEAAKRYNVLQKLAYVAVALILLPLMVLTGLAMSPGFDAIAPWLLDVLGGRQSARSLHFICANLIVLFVIVHVVEVFLAGVVNEIGSMITGRYALPRDDRA